MYTDTDMSNWPSTQISCEAKLKSANHSTVSVFVNNVLIICHFNWCCNLR